MKKLLVCLLTIILSLSLFGCFHSTEEKPEEKPEEKKEANSWAIYWYLCASDLESNGGYATQDLMEALEVVLPENVTLVIETGGTSYWQNDVMDSSKIQRWVYQGDTLTLVDEQRQANMGEADTLEAFLKFAYKNYPADKIAVTFWNHGGGSVNGAAFDENYNYDSLTIDEMREAFFNVFELSDTKQPIELVGFDTCLMATIDVAYTFKDIAHYLVGSEEIEPGNGWLYSGWLQQLADNPNMNGAELGKAICDSYVTGCKRVGTSNSITLSVTDLSKLEPLVQAYEKFGEEILTTISKEPGYLASFSRAALDSENYGGNNRDSGYANMLDLGHLARLLVEDIPSAQTVLDTLNDCIVYKINGPYRKEATGLSCFYSYDGDLYNLDAYLDLGISNSFKCLYSYEITGQLLSDEAEYLSLLNITLPVQKTLLDTDWDGKSLEVDEDGYAHLELGPEAWDILSDVYFSLYYVDEEYDTFLYLGDDNDLVIDWENGIITDNFRGVWGCLNGYYVFMQLSFVGDDYNIYAIPILINNVPCTLQVVYDFEYDEWIILGASEGIDENGMASKEMYTPQEGDEITIIWKLSSLSEDDDLEYYTVDSFVMEEELVFQEYDLFDGQFVMVFTMSDSYGNYAVSDAVIFDVIDGEIYTSTY